MPMHSKLCFFALAMTLLSSAAHAQNTCNEPRELIGLNGQAFFIQTADADYLDRFVQEYEDLGARSIRLGIDWQVIQREEPTESDNALDFDGSRYNPGWNYTEIVERFTAAGIEVQGLFNTAPYWVTDAGTSTGYEWLPETQLQATPENLQALTDTTRETLVYFYQRGGITRWEFWNEPHPSSMGIPAEYGKWFAAFLEGVFQAEQELQSEGVQFEIALGGLDGNTIDSWTRDVLRHENVAMRLPQIDAIAFHPYDRAAQTAEGLNRTMFDAGLAVAEEYDLDVWITEFGYNNETGELQRDKLCYALSWLSAQCRVTRANLHMLHDITEGAGCHDPTVQDPNCYGLINNDFITDDYSPQEDRKQPAWAQFQRLSDLFAGGPALPANGSACAPAAPQPVFPSEGQVVPIAANGTAITFQWQSVADPLGGTMTYQWDLYKCDLDGNNCTPEHFSPGDLTDTSDTKEVDCDRLYRWEIEARSSYGVPSPASSVVTFTTQCGDASSGLLDTALIIDSSGSMSGNDPVGQRRHAARIFFEVSPPEDHVGIIDFDSVVREGNTSDTLLRLGDAGAIDQLASLVYRIDSSGGTDIGRGLARSCQLLSGFDGHPAKAGILLTDGQGPWRPADRACYQQEGWSLWAIGFGDASLSQLQAIVGSPERAMVVSSAERALCELQQFRARITNDDTIPCTQYTVHPGAHVPLTATIPPGRTRMSFYTAWPGSDVVMTLTSPSGRVIGRSTTASDVRHLAGPTFEVYTIERPEGGTWNIDLFGADVRPNGEPVTFGGTVLAVGNVTNLPPDVSAASPSVATIWPPNHKMIAVEVLGVTDPEGSAVTIEVTGITQDEPVSSPDPKHAPDATGIGSATASLRAERHGNGNGRVYEIRFRASDEQGASAEGSVRVCVPHDQSGTGCTDSGQSYDSTAR